MKISLGQIQLPSGLIGCIESASRSCSNGVPPSVWLDQSMVGTLIHQHPIFVRKVDRHYEVVAGFRTFHVVSEICPADFNLDVVATLDEEADLARKAFFELVSGALLFSDHAQSRKKIFRELRNLMRQLRDEFGFEFSALLSKRKLRKLLNLSIHETKPPRLRHSELTRLLDSADGLK